MVWNSSDERSVLREASHRRRTFPGFPFSAGFEHSGCLKLLRGLWVSAGHLPLNPKRYLEPGGRLDDPIALRILESLGCIWVLEHYLPSDQDKVEDPAPTFNANL